MKNKRLTNEKLLYIDTDETLAVWDQDSYAEDVPEVTVNCYGVDASLQPHLANIKVIRKFHKLGYGIIIWSATGAEWAEAVSKAVGIDDLVTLYLTKPRYHMDDRPAPEWMGENVFRSSK